MKQQEQTTQIPVPETRRGGKAGSLVKKTIGAVIGSALLLTMPMGTSTANASEQLYAQSLMMHHHYTALNVTRDHLISGSGNGNRFGFRGQWADCNPCEQVLCDPCDPVCRTSGRFGGLFSGGGNRNAWVHYVGRTDEFFKQGSTENWRLSAEGVQAGVDLFRTQNTQFGTLFGYEGVRMRHTAGDLVKMDSTYVGLYGVRVFRNGADARVIFSYGHQEYDLDPNGAGTFSSFKGYTTETNLELGRRISSGRAWSIRPVVALDVFNNNLKGNETNDKTSLTQTFFRTGSDLQVQNRNVTLNSGIYYSYGINGHQALTAGTATASKPGRELWTFNLGTSFQATRSMSIFGGYKGEYVVDRANSQVHSIGYAGAGFKW